MISQLTEQPEASVSHYGFIAVVSRSTEPALTLWRNKPCTPNSIQKSEKLIVFQLLDSLDLRKCSQSALVLILHTEASLVVAVRRLRVRRRRTTPGQLNTWFCFFPSLVSEHGSSLWSSSAAPGTTSSSVHSAVAGHTLTPPQPRPTADNISVLTCW